MIKLNNDLCAGKQCSAFTRSISGTHRCSAVYRLPTLDWWVFSVFSDLSVDIKFKLTPIASRIKIRRKKKIKEKEKLTEIPQGGNKLSYREQKENQYGCRGQ